MNMMREPLAVLTLASAERHESALRPLFINLPRGRMLVEANRRRSCAWRSQSWRTAHLYRRQSRGRMLTRKGAAWLAQEHKNMIESMQ